MYLPYHKYLLSVLTCLGLLLCLASTLLYGQSKEGVHEFGLDPKKSLSQYLLESWKKDKGLPQNSVFAITQTHEGYLWLATYEGIARFDGVSFETYTNENLPALKSNSAWVLHEDQYHYLWIATNGGGLTQYKNGKASTLTDKDGLPSNVILALAESKTQNTLWIGTTQGLVAYHTKEKRIIRKYDKTDGLSSNQIQSLTLDTEGNLWIGTNFGINKISKKTQQIENITRKLLLVSKSINALAADEQGNIWLGTSAGLVKYNEKQNTQKVFTTKEGLTDEFITVIIHDDWGSIWVGSQNGGIMRIYRDNVSTLSIKEGLAANNITALCYDREGSLWIGMNRGGLNRLKDGKFVNYTQAEGIADNLTNCVYEDLQGTIWIGTANGGISHYKQGVFKNYSLSQDKDAAPVRSITQDLQGNIWAATYGEGVYYLEPNSGKIKHFTIDNGLPSNVVRALFRNKEGNILMATREGIALYAQGKIKTLYNQENGLNNPSIISIYEDKAGVLWAGSDGGGLYIIQPNGSISQYTTQKGLPNDIVFTVYEDKNNNFWIGTKGGLAYFDKQQLRVLTTKEGLPNAAVHSIAEDNQNKMWISCNNGVYWVQKQDIFDLWQGKIKKLTTQLYDEADGMKSSDCAASVQPSVCKDHNGYLWYPTTAGIATINPNSIKINRHKPNVVIKKFVADNIAYETYDSEMTIYLPAGTSKIEIDYTALSLLAPDKIHFKHILEGFEEDWTYVAHKRDVFYTNLTPGYYTFRVIASNNDGIWNDTGIQVKFYITPFFYQTIWFYIVVVVGLVFSGAGVYYWRVQALEKTKNALEKAIEERTIQITQQYKEITQQAEELERMDSIVRIINQELALEKVLTVLLEKCTTFFPNAEKAAFLFYEPQKQQFKLLTSAQQQNGEKVTYFDYATVMQYIEKGENIENDFHLLHPKQNNLHLFDNYQPISSLAMTIDIDDSNDTLEGILFFDSFSETYQITPQDIQRLQRFKEHALSAFSKAHILAEIATKNQAIEASMKKIADSFNYAKRIQEAIFVKQEEIQAQFDEAFVLYLPKDIVSGDFYWFAETIPEPIYSLEMTEEGKRESVFKGFSDSKKIIAAVDCTGHGVPGALMTVVGNDLLDMIVKEKQAFKPASILRQMDMGVKTYLKQEEGMQSKDGMDMSIIVIDEEENKIHFGGAKNPLWYVRNGELIEIKGSKFPIGGIQIKNKAFEGHSFEYQKGDIFYLFSDGYQDQFGGDNDRKFGVKRFRDFILEISPLPLTEQKEKLYTEIQNWKGETKQTDDILVIGIKM